MKENPFGFIKTLIVVLAITLLAKLIFWICFNLSSFFWDWWVIWWKTEGNIKYFFQGIRLHWRLFRVVPGRYFFSRLFCRAGFRTLSWKIGFRAWGVRRWGWWCVRALDFGFWVVWCFSSGGWSSDCLRGLSFNCLSGSGLIYRLPSCGFSGSRLTFIFTAGLFSTLNSNAISWFPAVHAAVSKPDYVPPEKIEDGFSLPLRFI